MTPLLKAFLLWIKCTVEQCSKQCTVDDEFGKVILITLHNLSYPFITFIILEYIGIIGEIWQTRDVDDVLTTAHEDFGEVMSQDGPKQAQELMSSVAAPAPITLGSHSTAFRAFRAFRFWACEVQKVCYSHEGTLNKFLIDDKGMHWAQRTEVEAIHHAPQCWCPDLFNF